MAIVGGKDGLQEVGCEPQHAVLVRGCVSK
jgi:hypothetical protein